VTPDRRCHFCGSSLGSEKSKEHVFPRWLTRELSSVPIPIAATRYAPRGEVLSVRNHTTNDLLLGGVCRTCNHGWMNNLERQARPIVRSLLWQTRDVRGLNDRERFVIGRWALKTAIALNLSGGFTRFFPAERVLELARHPLQLPGGVFVFAAQHNPTKPCDWIEADEVEFIRPSSTELADDAMRQIGKTGFRTALQFRSLCLAVVHWPHPQYLLSVWEKVHQPIWPIEPSVALCDHRYPGESDPTAVATRLFLYRLIETIGALDPTVDYYHPLLMHKNRASHISGPEPHGSGGFLPIPRVLTPEMDEAIKRWVKEKRADNALGKIDLGK